MKLVLAALFLLAAAWSCAVHATDFPGQEALWFDGAKNPECTSCCGQADGLVVSVRPDPDAGAGWDALVYGTWRPIPATIRATQCQHGAPVGDYRPHPVGSAVVWIVGNMLFCWSPPSGGL